METLGPEAGAARLLGDFAFAYRDDRRHALVLGRDPMGIRPLLFHDDGRRVAAATTAAALIDDHGVPFVPDEGIVAEILAGGPFSRSETLVRGIRRVLPGTTLTFAADRVEERVFRAIDPARVDLPADDEGCLDAFREALRNSIADRLRGAGPAALLLSGGLDSGTIAALAGEGTLRAFTVSFPGFPCDEADAARVTAAAAGIDIEVIPWSPPTADHVDGDARRGRDLPAFPTMAGAAAAVRAAGIRVVLDGEGGDEILQESPWRAADLLAEGKFTGGVREFVEFGLRPWLPGPLRRMVRFLRPADPLPRWIDPGFARRVGLRDRVRTAVPARGPGGFAGTSLAEEFSGGYALSCREAADRWGALCGAETRHPLSDLRLVETALALPDRLRSPEGEDRVALRRAQERIRFRADKAEFTPVLLAFLRACGFLDRPRVPLLAEAGWVDPAGIEGMVRDLEGRTSRGEPGAHADSMAAWTVFALESWWEQGRMSPP